MIIGSGISFERSAIGWVGVNRTWPIARGVSSTTVARIERGAVGSIPVGKFRRIAEVLGARFDTVVRWQGADLGRLLNARHAAMHEAMATLLGGLDGWVSSRRSRSPSTASAGSSRSSPGIRDGACSS
jgi:transcriptional regulator with XRE-family HTH domain